MKKIALFVTVAVMTAAFTACNDKEKAANETLQAKVDSLNQITHLQEDDIRDMQAFVNTMADGLDSIARMEGMLTKTAEGSKLSQAEVKQNLQELGLIIRRQKERIAQLEKDLKNSNSAYAAKLQKLVSTYQTQLEEKDKLISQLKEEAESKDFNIDLLTQANERLTTRVQEQREEMEEKELKINEAYVVIATEEELEAKGLLKGGGLFSKSKLDISQLQGTNVEKVDVRNYREVKIKAKKAKILTQMPQDSYTLTKEGKDVHTLRISDPSKFWSVSNYLVIQIKI